MSLFLIAVVAAGCAPEGIDEEEGGPEAMADGPASPDDPEEVGEALQELQIGKYSASSTNNATNSNVVKMPVVIAGGQTVMIGTAGLTGAVNKGDTFLRLVAPNGDKVKKSDDYACGNELGSRMSYTSPFESTKTFSIWGGCYGNLSCGTNTVSLSRRKGLIDFTATGTNNAKTGTTNKQFYFNGGDVIRASTCKNVATGAQRTGDTLLRIYRNDGGTFTHAKSNDDTESCPALCGKGSTILYKAPTAGYYQVRAGCFENTTCSGTVAVYVE